MLKTWKKIKQRKILTSSTGSLHGNQRGEMEKQFEQRNNTKNMIKGHDNYSRITGARKICIKREKM